MFARLFGSSRRQENPVALCYAKVVAQARRPEFYLRCGVPDTLDGRFDLLAVHAFLVMHRLKRQGGAARRFSRDLFEYLVTDMDRSVREMGVGDLGVAPRVKAMAKGFNGRLHAYDRALTVTDRGDDLLLAALDNNLFGTVLEPDPAALERMAGYVRTAAAELAGQPLAEVMAGAPRFPEPPGGAS